MKVNPFGKTGNLSFAAEKLLDYGRDGSAVTCVAHTIDTADHFDESLALRSLMAVVKSGNGLNELDNHYTVELIKHLQASKTADQEALFKIEWNFLPWLGSFSSGSPSTLERRLATDPDFFAELIQLVYRSSHDDENGKEVHDEQKQFRARNAFKLLTEWKRCPGIQEDGNLKAQALDEWVNKARQITEASGHKDIALIRIGHVFAYAPPDPNGLWIHSAIAEVLNKKDALDMRSGFTTELFNKRGVYSFSHGEGERKLAKKYSDQADALDLAKFPRFAAAIRELANQYSRDAEREEKRDLSNEF